MNKILCFFGKHNFRIVCNLGYQSQLLNCTRCNGSYAIKHDLQAVLPFDKEIWQMYKFIKVKNIEKLKKYISTRRFAWYW